MKAIAGVNAKRKDKICFVILLTSYKIKFASNYELQYNEWYKSSHGKVLSKTMPYRGGIYHTSA